VNPRHALEAVLTDAALGSLNGLAWPQAVRAGAALGAIAGGLGIRRGVARANLALAFPEWSREERERILALHYREMGRIAAEYGRLAALARAPENEVVTGGEGIDAVRALAGRGVLMVSGHIGNFELGAAWLARYNPVDFLVRPLSNKTVDARIERLRRAAGVGVISTHGGVKQVFKALRAGHWIAVAADQDAGRHGVFVPFFGRLASTAEGAARIGLQTGAPLFLGSMRRQPDGRHRLDCDPPRVPEGRSDEARVTELTAWHTALLERRVRETPEHYFWLHRRWKTRPPAGTGGEAASGGRDGEHAPV
jgi:KDO2-lipid IV(A) lauroyltransferase